MCRSPRAYTVSFKLETDEKILLTKVGLVCVCVCYVSWKRESIAALSLLRAAHPHTHTHTNGMLEVFWSTRSVCGIYGTVLSFHQRQQLQALGAINKYGINCVVANLLQTRYDTATIVTGTSFVVVHFVALLL